MSTYRNSVRHSKNPFGDEKEEERSGGDYTTFGNRRQGAAASEDEVLRQTQERIGYVENESLESTRRALRTLNETHEVGAKTAEELHKQGEQLRGVEERLDTVNSTLTSTQKNLNQIKSVFGGLRNKFFAPKTPALPPPSSSSSSKANMSTSKSMGSMKSGGGEQASATADYARITGSERESELNSNLEEMSLGLKRLANLGLDMQRELDRQAPVLDRLNDKTQLTKSRIDDQNSQMRRILK